MRPTESFDKPGGESKKDGNRLRVVTWPCLSRREHWHWNKVFLGFGPKSKAPQDALRGLFMPKNFLTCLAVEN